MFIGSFLPWVTLHTIFGSLSVCGMDGGDGTVTAVLGFATLIVGVLAVVSTSGASTCVRSLETILGLLCGGITLYEVVNVSNHISDLESGGEGFATASVGFGLWILLLGSILAVVAGALAMRRPRVTV